MQQQAFMIDKQSMMIVPDTLRKEKLWKAKNAAQVQQNRMLRDIVRERLQG